MGILSRPRPAHRPVSRYARLHEDRKARLVATVSLSAGWGALAGWWTPRDPLTMPEALTVIAVSLGVGALGGWLVRSRWTMLLAPIVFAVVFEITRASTVGPLVDATQPGDGGTTGLLAFALGRGLHVVLAILPMILGAGLGAGLARRRTEGRVRAQG